MPHVNSCARVLVADGFVCQYCYRHVYLGPAIKLLDFEAGDLELWDQHGRKEPLRHLWATVDHLLPLTSGGTDCLTNLVACCVKCNSSHGPGERTRPPRRKLGGWIGYADCFLALTTKHAGKMSLDDRKWAMALRWAGIQPTDEAVLKAIKELRQLKGGTSP